MLWNQPFKVVGVVTSATWVVQPAPGDDQFDAVYMPYTTTQRLLNLSKLNDITITASSSGEVTRCRATSPSCCASVTASATPRRTTSRSHAGDQGADDRRAAAERGARSRRQRRRAREGHARAARR